MSFETLVKIAKENLSTKEKALIASSILLNGGIGTTLASDYKVATTGNRLHRATENKIIRSLTHVSNNHNPNLRTKLNDKVNRLYRTHRRLVRTRAGGAISGAAGLAGLGAIGAHTLYKKINKGA